MATDRNGRRKGNRWRPVVWGVAGCLWLLPLAARLVTDQPDWDETDFIAWGVMLTVACVTYEIGARASASSPYRAAVGIAIAGAFLLVWMNLAVGIIGTEDNPLNLMYGGVLAVGLAGALIARLEPLGMARAMIAMAVAQGMVGAAALAAGHFTLVLEGFFAGLWLISSTLFRKAASEARPSAVQAG